MSGPISFGALFSVNMYRPMIPLHSATMFSFRLPACKLETNITETFWECASLFFLAVICSAGTVSPESVVYSFGTVLLDLLSGKHISPSHLSFPALFVLYSFREADCSVCSCSFRHCYDKFTPLEYLAQALKEDIEKIWDTVQKPVAYTEAALSDFFNVGASVF